MWALAESDVGVPYALLGQLTSDSGLIEKAARRILEQYFPESLWGSVLESAGLSLGFESASSEPVMFKRKRRNPNFRKEVLRAYEHRCAVTGFRAALGGSYFAVEAAHVRWHAYEGEDSVGNGLALNPLMHLLFDRGAWSLTDDRRIIVSAEFTGSDEATRDLRSFHGHPLRPPVQGAPVSIESIRWHREPQQGGVFRGPGLGL